MVRTAAPVSPGRSVAYSSLSTASEEYRSVSVLSPAMPSTGVMFIFFWNALTAAVVPEP